LKPIHGGWSPERIKIDLNYILIYLVRGKLQCSNKNTVNLGTFA
jgi:hypothetical protein